MSASRFVISSVFVCVLSAAPLFAKLTPPAQSQDQQGTTLSQRSSVRIVSPRAGQRFTPDQAIQLQYELLEPVTADGTPTFRVRIDGQDPSDTPFRERALTGLQPGRHQITVEVIDANGTPIAGSRQLVEFFVVVPPRRPGSSMPGNRPPGYFRKPNGLASTTGLPSLLPAMVIVDPETLGDGGSATPLVAVLGSAMFLGGWISARRGRRKRQNPAAHVPTEEDLHRTERRRA